MSKTVPTKVYLQNRLTEGQTCLIGMILPVNNFTRSGLGQELRKGMATKSLQAAMSVHWRGGSSPQEPLHAPVSRGSGTSSLCRPSGLDVMQVLL